MCPPIPNERMWLRLPEEELRHPYSIHRTLNSQTVEVVCRARAPGGQVRRWVTLIDGAYVIFVTAAGRRAFAYPLRDGERVSAAERAAIACKQRTLAPGATPPYAAVAAQLAAAATPAVRRHLLVAAYHAARADPTVGAATVTARKADAEAATGHILVSGPADVRRLLADVGSLAE